MSVYFNLLGTILGGLIAGLVGLLSTYSSRNLDRRERHLFEHKRNLDAIKSALFETKGRIWPLVNVAEELRIADPSLSSAPSTRRLKDFNLFDFVKSEPSERGEFLKVAPIDRILYGDLGNHFPGLAERLGDLTKSVESEGDELRELLSATISRLFEVMRSSDFMVLKWPYQKGVHALLKDLKGSIEEMDYAGIIFLFAIGEHEAAWPKRIAEQKGVNQYDNLKALGDELRKKMGKDIERMLSLKSSLFTKVDECVSRLETDSHKGKLRGRCKLI